MELFIEDWAFLQSNDSAPPPLLPPSHPPASWLSFSVFLCVSPIELMAGGRGVRGLERSQVICPRLKPGPLYVIVCVLKVS